MAELALAHDALLPRPPGGQGTGAALSLLVHAGLVMALTLSVDWRSKTPEVFSAELWAAVPQATPPPAATAPPAPAAPPPVEAPATPDADIAIERERQRKLEARKAVEETRRKAEDARKLAETEKAEKKAAEQKKLAEAKKAEAARREAEQQALEAKAEDERLARLREDNLKRMMGEVGGSTGGKPGATAAQNAGPSATYAGLVIGRVRPNIVFTGTLSGHAAAEVEVTAAPGGTIISRRLVKSSGFKDWDEAVLRAIDRTPALPRDTDGRVPQSLVIAFTRE